ncbi:hypothetical protein BJV82DRAFT_55986 [Fennellomyces sp. T-0311]|nr:hypothetical protein BJV82DRAFT_55986 [Fennellomyces sp. T-0311]
MEAVVSIEHLTAHFSFERFGIIPFGKGLQKNPDIPDGIYEALEHTQVDEIKWSQAEIQYIKSVLFSNDYGEATCAAKIFASPFLLHHRSQKAHHFLQRMLYTYSDVIHAETKRQTISDSETAYCHLAIWPFLRHTVLLLDDEEDFEYQFKVGETPKETKLFSV